VARDREDTIGRVFPIRQKGKMGNGVSKREVPTNYFRKPPLAGGGGGGYIHSA